ncbi:MAG: hypothetical protein V1722_00400 [Candidatus Micrarchaeota archaeon]
MNLKGNLSAFFIIIFTLEIFSPLAFAYTPLPLGSPATTIPTTIGSRYNVPGQCEVNEMTPEQVQLFWIQTQNFRGDQINSKTDEALMTTKPSGTTINLNVNNFPADSGEKVHPFVDIARLLGLDEKKRKEAAQFLGKRETDRISNKEAHQLAKKYEKNEGEFGTLLDAFRGTASEESPAYESYKLKTNGGGEIPSTALQGKTPIDECIINNAHVQGKASYVVSTSKDVAIAADSSQTQSEKVNFLHSTNTLGSLDLQGASTLIIPKHYKELVTRLKKWLAADLLASIGQTTVFFGEKNALSKSQEKLKEIVERKRDFGLDQIAFSRIQDSPLKLEVYGLGSRLSVTKSELQQSVEKMQLNFIRMHAGNVEITDDVIARLNTDPQFATRYNSLQKIQNELESATSLKPTDPADDIYQKYKNDLHGVAGINDADQIEIQNAQERLRTNQDYVKTLNDLNGKTYKADLEKVKRKLAGRTGESWFRLAMGMAWLGPGRFVFELADGVDFVPISNKAFAENYVTIMADNTDLAGEFRRATNWVLSGTVTDMLSDATGEGIPTAAYRVGNLIIVNNPVEDQTVTGTSVTSLQNNGGKWNIGTEWKGKSDALVAEQLTTENEYARLPMEVKGQAWNLKIRARQEFSTFYDTMIYLAPLLSWRILGATDYAVTIFRVAVYDFYVTDFVNPAAFKKDEVCSDEEIDKYVNWYMGATLVNQGLGWAPILTPWFKGLSTVTKVSAALNSKTKIFTGPFIDKYVKSIGKVLDPVTLAQMYIAGEALDYASNCKDDQYTILAYQQLKKKSAATISDRLQSIGGSDFLSKLNVGQAVKGVGQQVDTATMSEYVNFRAVLENQVSSITADEIYFLHFKGDSIEWINNIKTNTAQPEMCQRECLDSKTKVCCRDATGTECTDKATGVKTQIAGKERSLMAKRFTNLALVLTPNKYISTSLGGCPGNILQIDSSKNIQLTSGTTCTGGTCILNQLQYLTGRQVNSDLTSVLGKVTGIYTTSGSVQISDGAIRFNPSEAINDQMEIRSPGAGVIQTASSSEELAYKQAAMLAIDNNGGVTLSGYITSKSPEQVPAGELITIMTERGRINYMGGGRVQIFLHTLAQGDAGLINGFTTMPVQYNQCPGYNAPGIKISNLQGYAGPGDQVAAQLNAALQQIQGCNGMQVLETKDKKIMFGTNANGEPVLRIIDKNTGEVTEARINGPIRREGNEIIVPTDKGEFRFNIGMGENGQPMLSLTGPNGLQENGPLLRANGLGGMLVFDPATGQWHVLNGQDLAMNDNFAKYGTSYGRDTKGNFVGSPGADFLSPSSKRVSTSGNSLASLPSWPEESPILLVVIVLTLLAVAFVRWRKV